MLALLALAVAGCPSREPPRPRPSPRAGSASVDAAAAPAAIEAGRAGSRAEAAPRVPEDDGPTRPGECPEGATWRDGDDAGGCYLPDGTPHGPVVRYSEGRPYVRARYDRGQPSGTWTTLHPGGRPSERFTWEAGEKTGPTQTWYPSGARQSVGALYRGAPDGRWVDWHPDGRFRQVQCYRRGHLLWRSGKPADEAGKACPPGSVSRP